MTEPILLGNFSKRDVPKACPKCKRSDAGWRLVQVLSVSHARRHAAGAIWHCCCGHREFFGDANYDVLTGGAL